MIKQTWSSDPLGAHTGSVPFSLPFFSWGEGESWHRIGSASLSFCISLVPSETLLPSLSKRWGRGTGGIALIQAEIWEELAQKICLRRGHQWSASHSPDHRWIMRTSISHPHGNPFPCQTLFVDMAESGISLNSPAAFLPSSSGIRCLKSACASAGWRHCL